MSKTDSADPGIYTSWILCGGTKSFEIFLRTLAGEQIRLHSYSSIQEIPFEELRSTVIFLLPEYEKGVEFIRELPFETAEKILACLERDNSLYMENYLAQDYFHKQLSCLQILGGKRTFHQEYLEYKQTLLQARKSFYLPAVPSESTVLAAVSDCTGTHRIFREGRTSYPVLVQHKAKRIFGSAMDLSRMDVHFMRPRHRWCTLYADLFSRITNLPEERVKDAFEKTYPDFATLCGKENNAARSVKMALQWHWGSSLMRKADGTAGMFEMIRSNDLAVRSNLRTDSTLLTAAFFAAAGKKMRDETLLETGCNLADFLLRRKIQSPEGFFRWFDHSSMVYFSDCSRSALAMINLYKSTGIQHYLEAAQKAADALLSALNDNGLGCGFFDLKAGFANRSGNNNPVFYGEMVCFLLQLKESRYTEAALRIAERIGETFPQVAPFGFSDNFTYSRYLMMLSCIQKSTAADLSEKITPVLEFFFRNQMPCGGIVETPIRLEKHTEAGVGIGDGSDAIADLLYCNNYYFSALSVLVKLPPEKQRGLPMEKIRASYKALRSFLLEIQLSSSDGRFHGSWMRAFDMEYNEYFGLNKDMDWGSYCIMAGWVMALIPLVFLNEDDPEESFFFA